MNPAYFWPIIRSSTSEPRIAVPTRSSLPATTDSLLGELVAQGVLSPDVLKEAR